MTVPIKLSITAELPVASTTELGVVKIDGATITISENDVISATQQDLSAYATKEQVSETVSNLHKESQDVIDTLKKLGAELNDDESAINVITKNLASKANSADLAPVASSGHYEDLTGNPVIPVVPSSLSAFANDTGYSKFSGFYSDLQDKPIIPSIDGLATQTYVDAQVSKLIDGAPGALNTIKELADAISGEEGHIGALTNQIAGKANAADLAKVALTGSYTDLINTPVPPDLSNFATKTQIADLQAQISTLLACLNSGQYLSNSVVTDKILLYLDAAAYTGIGDWLDQSGNLHHAQLPGTTHNPTFIPQANNGSYFLFECLKAQYFNILNQDTMIYGTGANPRTLSGWINAQPTGNWQWLSSYGTLGTGQSMFIGFNGSMTEIIFGGYNGYNLACSKPGITWAGQWVNICATYAGTTAKLYVNGQLVATGQFNWNTVKGINTVGRQTNSGEFTNGKISNIIYYSKELSAAEVLQNYNALKVRYGL